MLFYYLWLFLQNLYDIFNRAKLLTLNADTSANKEVFDGTVTGIINSSKKCGVFVDIPELNITGMVQCKPSEIFNYKPGDELMVGIEGFEEETFYNKDVQQVQHLDPYIITEGCLEKCNLKPVLRFC